MHYFTALEGVVGSQLLGLGQRARAQLLGVDVGLRDEAGGLLLGHAKHVLELGSQSGIGGATGLVELGLQVLVDGQQALDFLGRLGAIGVGLDELATQLLDGAVDLVLLVPAHLSPEIGVVGSHDFSLRGGGLSEV